MELMQEFSRENSSEHVLQLVLKEDELSWQHILYDLVREERMDPWDINLTQVTQKFLEVIKALKELDFRVSGKIVLASALLLKIKSDRLLSEDLTALDALIESAEEPEEDFDLFMDVEGFMDYEPEPPTPRIYPRTPQPRQRKVSVYDLVTALEQALEVNVRRERRALDNTFVQEVEVPEHKFDVSDLMNNLLVRISERHQSHGEVRFTHLSTEEKSSRVFTFIPLLHLFNERRINMDQPEHFGEIHIHLLDDSPVQSEQPITT